MTRLVRLIVGLIALLIIVIFAIANRSPVEVSFAPLPLAIELPVYGVFLLGLVIGGLLGGAVVWLNGHPYRRDARRLRNRVWALENQLELLKKQERSAAASQAGRGLVAQGAA
jgi:uncharacterized integral membrane protein